MWCSVLTFIVFASLHDGAKSNLLDAVQGYVNTAVFGDTQIHNRASTWDTAPSIERKEGGVLTYINSEHTAIRVSAAAGNQQYLEGSEINIVCNVDGDPRPTILWYKDGNLIQPNNRINFSPFALIISAAEQSDAGRYRCEATNKYSSGAATVDIRVGAPNHPIITDRTWQNNQDSAAARPGVAAVAGSFGASNYPIITDRTWQNNQDTAAAGAGVAAVAGSFGAPNYPIITERTWQNSQVTPVAAAAAAATVSVNSGSFAVAAASA